MRDSDESSRPKLRKFLTLTDIFMLSITGMIGSAWLFSVVAGDYYAGPASILTWIIAGVFFIFMVFGFAELGGIFPFSGSLARYNHYTHGIFSNYLLAWAYFLGAVTTVSVEAIAIVTYASSYISGLVGANGLLTPLGVLIAAGLILLFTIIQLVGINVFGWFNRFITAWKILIPLITIILLISLYFHPSNFVSLTGGFAPYGTAAIFAGMIPSGIVFAYEGFRQGLEYAGEAKNPQRDVPLGTILAIVVVIIMYVLLQVAFTGGINWSAAGITPGNWTGLYNAWESHPFYSELVASGVPLLAIWAIILLIDAAISPAGTLAVYTGSSARNIFGMSRVGYIPEFLSKVHKKFRTPWIAILITFVLAIAFLLPIPSWYYVVSLSSLLTVYNYLTVGITNHALKNLAPNLKRPYKAPVWFITFPLGFVAAAMLVYWSGYSLINTTVIAVVAGLPLVLFGPYRNKLNLPLKEVSIFSILLWLFLAFIVAGNVYSWGPLANFPVYWALLSLLQIASIAYLYLKSHHRSVKATWWLIIFNILSGVISYYGSLGISPIIPYPYDYVVFVVTSLVVYFIGVKTAYLTNDLKDVIEKGLPEE
ncbi:amino acid transporter [Caldisphaera lagunensis DSM 15908]|uniref:Amino acid transporter n=1 Tax=Caldisphaera lagunensis (strain DSM 15908 / JCM 11604 / ANMR 0165 / IC-154) TaxID=1056495 RepID=L0AAF0_CALLD|nr:amino acid transporter [Caldisphaera lagunensis DSM 15908]